MILGIHYLLLKALLSMSMNYSTSNITASYLHSVIPSTKFVNQSEMIRCKMYILRLDYINIYGTGDIDLRNGEQREFQTREMSKKGNWCSPCQLLYAIKRCCCPTGFQDKPLKSSQKIKHKFLAMKLGGSDLIVQCALCSDLTVQCAMCSECSPSL